VMIREERMLGYFVGFEFHRRRPFRDRPVPAQGRSRDQTANSARDFGRRDFR
jgi:hypothetical protein